MTSELLAILTPLFTNTLFLRLIVLVAVVTVFSLLYLVAERLTEMDTSGFFKIRKDAASVRSAMILSSQK
jgi:hypothetical protein